MVQVFPLCMLRSRLYEADFVSGKILSVMAFRVIVGLSEMNGEYQNMDDIDS